jgi:hypothetical protein
VSEGTDDMAIDSSNDGKSFTAATDDHAMGDLAQVPLMTTSMDSVDAKFAIAERRCAIQAIMREKSRLQLESRASMTSKRVPPADQTQTLYLEYGQRHPPSIFFSFSSCCFSCQQTEN